MHDINLYAKNAQEIHKKYFGFYVILYAILALQRPLLFRKFDIVGIKLMQTQILFYTLFT